MKNEKKQLQNEKVKMEKLEGRRSEMWVRHETARGELGEAKQVFGRELVDGGDVEKLSKTLSHKESALTIIAAGLAELDAQITSQQTIVSEAEVALAAAETTATMKLTIKDAVSTIKLLANAQVDVHRNIERTARMQSLRSQHGVRGGQEPPQMCRTAGVRKRSCGLQNRKATLT